MLGVLLIAGAVLTALYWISYFTGGDVRVSEERWYTAFESAFPVADGFMAVCMLAAGLGLWSGRAWGAPFGLLAGSALIFLTAMDVTFNVGNGLYALLAESDAMKAELAINAGTGLLGAWSIWACWPRTR